MTHELRMERLRTESGLRRFWATCSCGWEDPDGHFAMESSAWEGYAAHLDQLSAVGAA